MTAEEFETEPEAVPIANEILPARVMIDRKTKAGFDECTAPLSPELQKKSAWQTDF